eukprot:COSAG01_NODE_1002_length_12208_cov_63.234701_1_plen_297_part_00
MRSAARWGGSAAAAAAGGGAGAALASAWRDGVDHAALAAAQHGEAAARAQAQLAKLTAAATAAERRHQAHVEARRAAAAAGRSGGGGGGSGGGGGGARGREVAVDVGPGEVAAIGRRHRAAPINNSELAHAEVGKAERVLQEHRRKSLAAETALANLEQALLVRCTSLRHTHSSDAAFASLVIVTPLSVAAPHHPQFKQLAEKRRQRTEEAHAVEPWSKAPSRDTGGLRARGSERSASGRPAQPSGKPKQPPPPPRGGGALPAVAGGRHGAPGVSNLCDPFWLRFTYVAPVLVTKY